MTTPVPLTDQQIRDLLSQLTLEEKINLTVGVDNWTTYGIERLGVGPIVMNDGPHGLRKPYEGGVDLQNAVPATCFPPAVSMAASWDPDLMEEVGRALGEECLENDVQIILGPGVNIKRIPLGGRNFEYFSEDPVLAGEMGAAHVRGVQSQGVGTSLKHYAVNNQEFERMTISAEVSQRALRELYLAVFERVVRKAQPWTVMAAYNKVNGTYATEHHQLLTEILKDEWGFEGVVVSDWGAVDRKDRCLSAGLDLEMPGPRRGHAEMLARFIEDGSLSVEDIDKAAARMLRLILIGSAGRRTGFKFDRAAHHTLARRAAAESTVLLKNDGALLPLDHTALKSVAVIGRFAKTPRYQGSGSSQVNPTRMDNALDAITAWLGDGISLTYAEANLR